MNKGDRVKILTGFYQGMEGYIEDFKDGQCIVALKNDNGYVNTMMYPKRLELVEEETLLSKIHERILDLNDALDLHPSYPIRGMNNLLIDFARDVSRYAREEKEKNQD